MLTVIGPEPKGKLFQFTWGILDRGRHLVLLERKEMWILIPAAPEKAQGKRRCGVEETAPFPPLLVCPHSCSLGS